MSIIRDVKNVKMKHGDDVVLVKSGNFYRCYDKDSYIISYIMNYQIKQVSSNSYMCGFPISSLEKVINSLQTSSINYRVIDFKREDKLLLKNAILKLEMLMMKFL